MCSTTAAKLAVELMFELLRFSDAARIGPRRGRVKMPQPDAFLGLQLSRWRGAGLPEASGPMRLRYSTTAMSWPTTNGVVPSSSQSELSSEFPVRMTVSAMSWVQPLLLAELPENLTSEAGM